MTGGYETVSDFSQKTTSFFCFVVVGLNCIYHLIKNKSGSNTEPCGTPEFILSLLNFGHLAQLFVFDL